MAGTPITTEQLAAWREIEAKATPGPWVVNRIYPYAPGTGNPRYIESQTGTICQTGSKTYDAELIAESRNAFPVLLDEVERLQADNARLRGLLRRIHGWDHMDSAADGTYWRSEITKELGDTR